MINYVYYLSLITWYEYGASIKNTIHQTKTNNPITEVKIMLLNSFQLKIRTKNPKLIIDQGWHQ